MFQSRFITLYVIGLLFLLGSTSALEHYDPHEGSSYNRNQGTKVNYWNHSDAEEKHENAANAWGRVMDVHNRIAHGCAGKDHTRHLFHASEAEKYERNKNDHMNIADFHAGITMGNPISYDENSKILLKDTKVAKASAKEAVRATKAANRHLEWAQEYTGCV